MILHDPFGAQEPINVSTDSNTFGNVCSNFQEAPKPPWTKFTCFLCKTVFDALLRACLKASAFTGYIGAAQRSSARQALGGHLIVSRVISRFQAASFSPARVLVGNNFQRPRKL